MITPNALTKSIADTKKNEITITKTDLPPLEEYIVYLKELWSNGWLTNDGKFVQTLEKQLEEYLGVKNLLLVSNGTLALEIALKALKIKGEVITTPFTFAATTNTILWENLTPVFADIDPKTYNIDPKDIEKKINDDTGAILAVHLYGNPCYIEEIQNIADEYDLKVIYDAAHAFGVDYKNKSVLNNGNISTISFHATKIFSTIEGGAMIIKDKDIFEKVKLMRNHGIKSEEEVIIPGTNAKMNEFQAIIGICNLKSMNNKIRIRKNIYNYYKEKLSGINGIKFQKIITSSYNYAYMPLYLTESHNRDKIYSELLNNGIKSRKYFYPLTANFDYFKDEFLVEKYNLDTASDISNKILCLPLYPELQIDDVKRIITLIKRILET